MWSGSQAQEDGSEVRHPAGQGYVAEVPAAMDEPRLGKKDPDQTEVLVVVGHLVHDAKGPPVEGSQPVQRAAGQDARAVSRSRSRRHWKGVSLAIHGLGQRLQGFVAIAQLAGPEHQASGLPRSAPPAWCRTAASRR